MYKILITICLLSFSTLATFSQNYQTIPGGITSKSSSCNVEIRFYTPKIVRIVKYPLDSIIKKKTLSVILKPENVDVKLTSHAGIITLKSSALSVSYDPKSNSVTFNDLNGKKLLKEKADGFKLTPMKDVDLNRYSAFQSFKLDIDEAIFGLGQQQNNKLNQRNEKIHLENGNTQVSIPYFQSTKGYGIFWDNYSPTEFKDSPEETSFDSQIADLSDYYFMYGKSGDGVIARMRQLTGQAPMMPFWTFGFTQSRERYKTQFELLDVVKKYRDIHVPLDGIVQDWQYWGPDSNWNAMSFDPKTYPRPQEWVDSIHNLHAHLFIVAWPGFGPKTPQFAEFNAKHYLINFHTWPPKVGARVYDPYNPAARDLYWKYLNKGIFHLGIDAWWLDSSEPDHIDVKPQDFEQPTYLGSFRSVQNAFPLMHVGNVYAHQRATTSNQRVMILTRSAFAGQQRYGANTWSGDIISQWPVLQKQIPAALNFTMTGIPYWNADIGGFFADEFIKGGGAKNPEFQELYTRWLEFATFTPLMRSHGTQIPREIYQFGTKGDWAYDAQEKFINLRYHLLPYLYATAWDVTHNSGSIMRALYLDYPKDKKVYDLGSEFLLGQSLLVSPVTEKSTKSQSVYLPAGQWFDFWTGKAITGGASVDRSTPMDIVPLYVKAGSVIPWGPKVEYSSEKKWDDLEIRIYPGANGSFALYEDEGNNYNYEKGKYTEISFHYDQQMHQLTIDQRKGDYKGMLNSRNFNVVIVNSKNGIGVENSTHYDRSVHYNGQKTIIKF